MKSTCVSYIWSVCCKTLQTDVNNFGMVSRCASCLEIITCIALMCCGTHAAIHERGYVWWVCRFYSARHNEYNWEDVSLPNNILHYLHIINLLSIQTILFMMLEIFSIVHWKCLFLIFKQRPNETCYWNLFISMSIYRVSRLR